MILTKILKCKPQNMTESTKNRNIIVKICTDFVEWRLDRGPAWKGWKFIICDQLAINVTCFREIYHAGWGQKKYFLPTGTLMAEDQVLQVWEL